MLLRSRYQPVIALLVITSLLLNGAAPTTYAQSEPPVYLPLIAGGQAADSQVLFRTQVTVQTPAQWRDLTNLGVVILEKDAQHALLLVDDQQLTALARWRFNPAATNALATLAAADAGVKAAVAPLLAAGATLAAQLAQPPTTVTAADQARTALQTTMQALTAAQQATIAAAATADGDNDGLTDDQEGFWCTDLTRPDSDFDGTSDGAEVSAIKAWLNNQRAGSPSTSKPFQGWPPQKTNCFDDDQDSVPDLAESLELGLNPNRESTDRDKFDDGQELFGLTYCTGQGGFCSYGPLPRNEDWGVIFAEMPSWVKAPGNHPLVAAFPVPEVDVVASSLKVETVTTVTTDHVIGVGEQRSYSTSKTDGKSKSVADTITWNKWQEMSETSSQQTMQRATEGNNDIEYPPYDPKRSNEIETEVHHLTASAAKWHAWDWVPIIGVGTQMAGQTREASAYVKGVYIDKWKEDAANKCDPNAPYWAPKCLTQPVSPSLGQDTANDQKTTVNSQDLLTTKSGIEFSVNQSNEVYFRPTFDISFPVASPPPTRTETEGESWGGSQTVSTEEYEEHTVTNGEAFSNEESWGTATAVDSAHAADLTFTYKVRNPGTEYAREIANLAFNLYIGADPNPAYTYFVAPDLGGNGKFQNFMPSEEHSYASRRIPLSLEQMKTIDLGGPVRVVVEDFTYGIDELFYQDAANAGLLIALEDGTADSDEAIDSYLIPTWGQETVLQVLARYFPHETDTAGTIIAIWTPEYRTDTPSWCQSPRRPTDFPSKALWCKHTLSTADWWNVYTDGLGDGGEGFQSTPAAAGAVALFRFNQDRDLDGFSDRSEARLGTDANDASSFPRPEVLAGVHNTRTGNQVVSTLALLNTGRYDAYGVEAVMVAPDDSVTITNNTVGGSGRVRALKQVIVGSRVTLAALTSTPWSQANHAVPAAAGYYTGSADRTYTLTVACGVVAGCAVGSGNWNLQWNDGKGASGQLDFSANYQSPTFLPVGALGVTVALYSGTVKNGERFTVAATTPRDTFQYTINREPYTAPLVIVSYNDPQGNHRFVIPPAAMTLGAPTTNLQQFAGTMLANVGVEVVTRAGFTPGSNSATLLVNNPAATTLQAAHLFLEVINISGTVVAEVPTQVTLPPGPTAVPVSFNTNSFSPAYIPADDYIVMAFLTDYQGNILDTAGRPLSSFQADPLPTLAVDDTTLTWNFGTLVQGALLKHPLALANTGFGRLYTYVPPASGLALNTLGSRTVGAADQPTYELLLRTAALPVGAYDQTLTIATSDPAQPARTVRVQGTITAASGATSGTLLRPLDVPVTVTGNHSQGEWIDFTHNLGPDAASLQPVKVYSSDYGTLSGVGAYATNFGQGTASYDMFGDGRDGVMPSSGNLNDDHGFGWGWANGTAGLTSIQAGEVHGLWRINPGDAVLIHQTQGSGAGCWELNKAVSDFGGEATYQLTKPLKCNYSTSGNNKAQIMRVPQYSTCNVTNIVTATGWNGSWGGIFAVMCNGSMNISGTIDATGLGFRGGISYNTGQNQGGPFAQTGEGTSVASLWQVNANGNGGGGGEQNSHGGPGGGGGGHTTTGNQGTGSNGAPGQAGSALELASLENLNLGGGGGGGGRAFSNPGGNGGNGGGIVVIQARNLNISGSITANGINGNSGSRNNPPPENQYGNSGGGGGGAGGTVLIKVESASLSNEKIASYGGSGGGAGGSGAGYGGGGSIGRNRVEYCDSMTGTTNPPASTQKLNCYITEQVATAPYTTARLNLPESFSDGRSYQVQFGRKLDFAAAGNQVTTLRVPTGPYQNIQLDALISNLPANATLSVDVGNDGTVDWSTTVTNNATTPSPDLANAFTAYWRAQGAPATGNLDVPLKVTINQAGQVLLTNLRVTSATSTLSAVRLPARPYTGFNLDLTVGEDVLFYDDFQTSAAESWIPTQGTWQVIDGVFDAVGKVGNILDAWAFTGDTTWTDYSLQTRLNMITGNGEILVRSTEHWQNEYRISVFSNSASAYPNDLALFRYKNGVVTTLWRQALPIQVPSNVVVRVDVVGNRIQVYLDGTKWIDFTDSDPLPAGRIGLGVIWDWHARFDDVQVVALGATTAGAPVADAVPYNIAVDVGDDQLIDWSYAATGPAPFRLTTGNLATALNSYLSGRSGEVTVPVRLYVSPGRAVHLNDFTTTYTPAVDLTATNLTLSPAGTVNPGDQLTVRATLRNSGSRASGPLTAAFFATAAGWGDWYIGSVFVADLAANSTVQVNTPWNTTGFSGSVPVKVVVNPYRRVGESNYNNNTASSSVTIIPLTTPTPTLTPGATATPTPCPTSTIPLPGGCATITPTLTPTPTYTPTPTPTPILTPTPNPSAVAVTLPTNATGAPSSQVTIPVQLPGTVNGLGIVAYDFTITFDPTVLTFASASTAGTLSNGWNITPNTATAGAVQIVAFNAASLAGSGTLINLIFNVVGAANSATGLTWTNFVFNEGEPAAQTSNGLFTVRAAWNVGGTVTYRTTTRPMSGLTLDLSGASTASTTTNSNGGYSFTVQASGAHTVTPSKSGGVNGISAFDAAYIAQCVAAVRNLADCPLLAADTSGNNALSAFDAAQVAQYVAGLAGPTSRVGRWVFNPANRAYATLTSDLTTENYGAYLVGEVSGNWQPPAATAAQQTTGDATAVPLTVATAADGRVTLGHTGAVSDLLAYQLTLHYDPSLGSLVEVIPDAAVSADAGWELVVNEANPGVVEIVGYGVTPVNGSATLVSLHFQDGAGQTVMPTVSAVKVQLNEESAWPAGDTPPSPLPYQQLLPLINN